MNNKNQILKESKEFLQFMNRLNSENNEKLKKIFGKYIKQSFLIRVKEEIKHSYEFSIIVPNCYDLSLNQITALGMDDIDFDLCINITMINWYLLLPISNDELKSEQYKNTTYISEIKNRTIKQCKLRRLVQNNEEKNCLLVHSPINYSMHCMVNYLLERMNMHLQNKNKSDVPNANFKINMICVMLKTIRAILLLTEYDNCGNAFSLLRSLIETIFVYLAIYDNEKVANEYYKFMEFREIFETTGQYPDEFKKLTSAKCNKQNYLNYGWLDKLKKKNYKYIFSEVIDCSVKTSKEYNKTFLNAYQYCCKYVHGNYLNQMLPEYGYIWILIKAGEILINIAKQFAYIFNEDIVFNEINLEEYLIECVEETSELFKKLQK